VMAQKGIQGAGACKEEESLHQNSSKDDLKKLKNENLTYQETINRLVDHILSQPGLMKFIGLTEEV